MQYLQKATFAQALMERTWMKEQEAKQLYLQITGTMNGQSESAFSTSSVAPTPEAMRIPWLHFCAGSRLVTVSMKTDQSRKPPLPSVGVLHLKLSRLSTTLSVCRVCLHGHGGIGGCRSHGL